LRSIRNLHLFKKISRISCPLESACSATADFSVCPSLQLLLCSAILVLTLRLVVPMYTDPQLQGILYTPEAAKGSRLSLADLTLLYRAVWFKDRFDLVLL